LISNGKQRWEIPRVADKKRLPGKGKANKTIPLTLDTTEATFYDGTCNT